MGRPFVDISCQRFGRLVAQNYVDGLWFCHCDCGNVVKVTGSHLRQALKQSCGCLAAESRSMFPPPVHIRHGGCGTPEYAAYKAAKYRCETPTNAEYTDYGQRGIKFLFTSFEQFLDDVGKRPSPQHSLDRKDNDGHYAPGNVRWATLSEQQKNKRWHLRLRDENNRKFVTRA